MQSVNTNNYLNIPLILPNMGRWNVKSVSSENYNNLLTKHIYNLKQNTHGDLGPFFKWKNKKNEDIPSVSSRLKYKNLKTKI